MNRHRPAAVVVFLSGAAMPAAAQVLYDNGGVVTSPTPACIPLGAAASQLQTVGGFPNGLIGIGCQLSGGTDNRAADDFVVPAAGSWTIGSVEFFAYQTLWESASSPITAVNIRIWNAKPGSPGAAVIWGDTTTNRLTSTTFSGIYRVPSACLTSRLLFRCAAQVTVTLPPGTYWLDYQAVGSPLVTGPWTPVVTLTGLRGKPGANAVQYQSSLGTWDPVFDEGPAPPTSPPVAQDFPFVIYGTCFSNCDGSTGTPLLTANDFQCFINQYAGNSSHANCDGSTVFPVLTANDFQCFLDKYASGCT